MKSGPDGSLIPMAEQDRSRRDRSATEEGIALVTAALPRGPIGPYQLQAAIAALHDEAQSPEATDWPQIAALYDVLLRLDDNPVSAYTQPGWPRTSSSSATSIDRSLACRAGRPPDSDFEDHAGLEGELGFGLDRDPDGLEVLLRQQG